MTAFQRTFLTEIKDYLKLLGASDDFFQDICTLMNQYGVLYDIYPNTVINALKIAYRLQQGHTNIGLTAPMQSGKSGTIFFLCNYVLPEIGYLKGRERVLFVTSMRDVDLYTQNCRLTRDFYNVREGVCEDSRIQVLKIDGLFGSNSVVRRIDNNNIKAIIRDEDQYGCGQESTFDRGFFSRIRRALPSLPLVSVSATLYDLSDAKSKGFPVEIENGFIPPNYFGISQMIELGLIEDLPRNFRPYTKSRTRAGGVLAELTPKMDEYMQHLMSFEDGIGIVRVTKTDVGKDLKDVAESKYGRDITCMIIGSNGCDFSISDGIQEVKSLVVSQGKRVLLIVIQALAAGKDFGRLKEKIRFGIESRNRQLANGAQGIPGRICGYHNNRSFKLMASLELLDKYVIGEENIELLSQDKLQKEAYNANIKGLSTQTIIVQDQKESVITKVTDYFDLDIEELRAKGRGKLSFLTDDQFKSLLSFFVFSVYSDVSSVRLGNTGVPPADKTTVRVASNYNLLEDNRVFKNWKSVENPNADFGSIFFKKTPYAYGILVSNFPVGHHKNRLGFCGVRVLQSGDRQMVSQELSTQNNSMY